MYNLNELAANHISFHTGSFIVTATAMAAKDDRLREFSMYRVGTQYMALNKGGQKGVSLSILTIP